MCIACIYAKCVISKSPASCQNSYVTHKNQSKSCVLPFYIRKYVKLKSQYLYLLFLCVKFDLNSNLFLLTWSCVASTISPPSPPPPPPTVRAAIAWVCFKLSYPSPSPPSCKPTRAHRVTASRPPPSNASVPALTRLLQIELLLR
jgi:hypothetical protein